MYTKHIYFLTLTVRNSVTKLKKEKHLFNVRLCFFYQTTYYQTKLHENFVRKREIDQDCLFLLIKGRSELDQIECTEPRM